MATHIAERTSQALKTGLKKSVPSYYQALLNTPPPEFHSRTKSAILSESASAIPSGSKTTGKSAKMALKSLLKPQPIFWEKEDFIRSRFYADHPWERNRPQTLVEGWQVGESLEGKPTGKDWRELSQRSRFPSVTDAVDYTMHLYQTFKMPLDKAYKSSVAQFRALKASNATALRFAQYEAEALGGTFDSIGYIGAGALAESRALASWRTSSDGGSARTTDSSRPILVPLDGSRPVNWSRGDDYVRVPDKETSEVTQIDA